MKYSLVNSTTNDVDRLIKYKLNNILYYDDDLSSEELEKIYNYVTSNVLKKLSNYKNIIVDDKIVGCLLVDKEKDGILLNEIYIELKYRNHNVGSDIIKRLILKNNIIYLWVYKKNKRVIKLYQKLGFNIIDETKTRFYMKYKKDNYNINN